VNFPAIDVLRALAALSVLVYHVIEMGQWSGFPAHGPLTVFRYGWAGVNLFLVISGFVIGLTALHGFSRDGLDFRRPFVRRRLARVVPLYLLTGLVYVLLVESSLLFAPAARQLTHFGSHLLFLHNLNHETYGTLNGPNWSVALEMQFYLAILLATPWLARLNPWRMLLGAVLFSALYRWVTTLWLPPGASVIHEQHVAAIQLPGVLDHFAMGIFLARAVRGEAGAWWQAQLTPGWLGCLKFTAAAAVLVLLAGWVLRSGSYWDRTSMIVGFPLLLAMALAMVVTAAIAFPAPRAALLQPLRYPGIISYGIYLWHVPVLLSLLARYPTLREGRLLAFTLACTLLLAAFSWHAFEKPWIRRSQTQ
jgi:peptidoglycan/LPS O-acetylase OafA/YrhL